MENFQWDFSVFFLLLLVAWVGFLVFAPAGVRADQADVDRLQRLVETGQYQEAFTLGRELRPEYEGRLTYDYWYGRAAIATDHLGEGVLALQRVLVRSPGFDRARLELARALYLQGFDRRAEKAFRTVLARDPPPTVVDTIERYLQTIRRRADKYRRVVTGYVTLAVGYDDNMNSATDRETVETGFGPLELVIQPSGRSSSDRFANYGAGVKVSRPVAPDVNIIGGIDADGRGLDEEHQFATSSVDAWSGAEIGFDQSRLRLTGRARRFYLAKDPYRDHFILNGTWRTQLEGPWVASIGTRVSRLRYEDLDNLDSTVGLLRSDFARGWNNRFNPTTSFGVFVGKEWAQEKTDAARAVAERDITGLRAGVTLDPPPAWLESSDAWRLRADVHYRRSDYAEEEFLFSKKRTEDLSEVSVALEWKPTLHWTAGPRLRYSQNESNINLYEYDRTVVELGGRYNFF